MPVIAMTREMGSLGRDMALGLAEELGLAMVQHEVVDHVADKMHVGASSVNRFLEGDAGLLERWKLDRKSVSLFTAEEIFELAAKGNVVIRGWGAAHLLRPIAHVLSVRVCAPMAKRAEVMMDRIGIDDQAAARREIEKNDAAHTRTMTQLGHADWQNPLHYDLVINSAQVPVAAGVAMMKQLVRDPAFAETEESRSQLADLKLEAAIRATLKSHAGTKRLDSLFDVAIKPGSGEVVMTGMVDNDDISAETEELIRKIPGVKTVRNDLLIATRLRVGP
ncbi:MAG: cytidylate kinase family protein [Alphaproteobacteria bacterium]|nr:cytidylate kinase family protein [Alphaproteobacteria bacterium]